MGNAEWIQDVEQWLNEAKGGDAQDRAEAEWKGFDDGNQTVLTIFGTYDTGKSSLLRRLLVDQGRPVPEWLTISAKKETALTSEIELLGCLIRDTPGISTREDALRSAQHNRESISALSLTDALMIVVNPQLATEELETIRQIVASEWPSGSLMFVISRFDEAGESAEDDADRYFALAQRKEQELRSSLGLDPHVPVYVVSQDAGQLAGQQIGVDPSVWDETRAWDGMDSLASALGQLGQMPNTQLRSAAERRFWRATIADTCVESRGALLGLEQASQEAGLVIRRRESWLEQLLLLERTGSHALEAELTDAVVHALAAEQTESELMNKQIQGRLDQWWSRYSAKLSDFCRSVDDTLERQTERPGWAFLEFLSMESVPEPRTSGQAKSSANSEKAASLANKLLDASSTYFEVHKTNLKEHSKAQRASGGANSSGALPSQKASSSTRSVKIDPGAVIKAAPELIAAGAQIWNLVAGFLQDRAEQKAALEHHEASEKLAEEFAATVAIDARAPWVSRIAEVRESIEAATEPETRLHLELEQAIPALKDLLQRGEALRSVEVAGS